jgi:putative tryptophan/tyrosine transport system substrate-binding protein
MRRRELLSLLGGAAVSWALAARAQQQGVPVIGYLRARSPEDTTHLLDAVRRGLGELGFVEGQNVVIVFKYALGQYDRLPEMAAELVRGQVSVLTVTGGENAAYAARAATATIRIIFVVGGDPIVKLALIPDAYSKALSQQIYRSCKQASSSSSST